MSSTTIGPQGSGPPGPETLRAMNDTVDRAVTLANQMLALAKVEQVHGEAQRETLNLAEIASDVAIDLSPLIADKHIDFELDANDALIRGHPWMLRELLRNLLHNAIRETPEGSTLSVLVVPGAQHVRVIVRDSGPGISASQREHLFEPFHTGHPNTGSGLGLAICREICQSLDATIELVNRTEQGRTAGLDAIVVFPAAPPPAG